MLNRIRVLCKHRGRNEELFGESFTKDLTFKLDVERCVGRGQVEEEGYSKPTEQHLVASLQDGLQVGPNDYPLVVMLLYKPPTMLWDIE